MLQCSFSPTASFPGSQGQGHYPRKIPRTSTEPRRAPRRPRRTPEETPAQTPETPLRGNFLGEPRGGLCPRMVTLRNFKNFVCCSATVGKNDIHTAEKQMLQCNLCRATSGKLHHNCLFQRQRDDNKNKIRTLFWGGALGAETKISSKKRCFFFCLWETPRQKNFESADYLSRTLVVTAQAPAFPSGILVAQCSATPASVADTCSATGGPRTRVQP